MNMCVFCVRHRHFGQSQMRALNIRSMIEDDQMKSNRSGIHSDSQFLKSKIRFSELVYFQMKTNLIATFRIEFEISSKSSLDASIEFSMPELLENLCLKYAIRCSRSDSLVKLNQKKSIPLKLKPPMPVNSTSKNE